MEEKAQEEEEKKNLVSVLHVSVQKKTELGYVNLWYEISTDF